MKIKFNQPIKHDCKILIQEQEKDSTRPQTTITYNQRPNTSLSEQFPKINRLSVDSVSQDEFFFKQERQGSKPPTRQNLTLKEQNEIKLKAYLQKLEEQKEKQRIEEEIKKKNLYQAAQELKAKLKSIDKQKQDKNSGKTRKKLKCNLSWMKQCSIPIKKKIDSAYKTMDFWQQSMDGENEVTIWLENLNKKMLKPYNQDQEYKSDKDKNKLDKRQKFTDHQIQFLRLHSQQCVQKTAAFILNQQESRNDSISKTSIQFRQLGQKYKIEYQTKEEQKKIDEFLLKTEDIEYNNQVMLDNLSNSQYLVSNDYQQRLIQGFPKKYQPNRCYKSVPRQYKAKNFQQQMIYFYGRLDREIYKNVDEYLIKDLNYEDVLLQQKEIFDESIFEMEKKFKKNDIAQ